MQKGHIIVLILSASVILSSFMQAGADEGQEQTVGWKKELVGAINLTQASFDNWAQGGENTLGWQLALNGNFTHRAPKHEWANGVKLAYGMTKIGDEDAVKSVDEIKLESVFAYKAGFFVDPYAAATAETQFSKGYKYEDVTDTAGITTEVKTPISNFLDPAYFTQSAGIQRQYGEVLKTRLGAAIKETVTDKYPKPYADDPETEDEVEKTKVEAGAESVTDLNLKLSGNLLFTSKLELFSNLEATNEIDVKWDNLLTAKIEEYLSVNLNVKLFYDRDISKSRQIKQSLAIGLTYSFI
jgi:hypothetical protein